LETLKASTSFCEQKEAKKLCLTEASCTARRQARINQKFFAAAREGLLFFKKEAVFTA